MWSRRGSIGLIVKSEGKASAGRKSRRMLEVLPAQMPRQAGARLTERQHTPRTATSTSISRSKEITWRESSLKDRATSNIWLRLLPSRAVAACHLRKQHPARPKHTSLINVQLLTSTLTIMCSRAPWIEMPQVTKQLKRQPKERCTTTHEEVRKAERVRAAISPGNTTPTPISSIWECKWASKYLKMKQAAPPSASASKTKA